MGSNKYFKDMGFRVTSTYDWRTIEKNGATVREFHCGVDLVAPKPQGVIETFTDGTVVFAGEAVSGSGYGGFGNAVAIKDKNGCIHVYGHISKWLVKVGEHVKKGYAIAKEGNAGLSIGHAHDGYLAGEHLHYEIRKSADVDLSPGKREHRCHVPDDYLINFFKESTHTVKADNVYYTIKSGDTLSEIAAKHKITVDKIMKLNPEIKDVSKIKAGQKIKI